MNKTIICSNISFSNHLKILSTVSLKDRYLFQQRMNDFTTTLPRLSSKQISTRKIIIRLHDTDASKAHSDIPFLPLRYVNSSGRRFYLFRPANVSHLFRNVFMRSRAVFAYHRQWTSWCIISKCLLDFFRVATGSWN
jgi:hypothetical protein